MGKFVTSAKKAKELLVVHDDLDLPLGRMKISFNKSSGGHKGVESVMSAVKTEAFWRLRVGISKAAAGGKTKKPSGDALINNFIVSPFKPSDATEFKKIIKKAVEVFTLAATDGCEKAMMEADQNSFRINKKRALKLLERRFGRVKRRTIKCGAVGLNRTGGKQRPHHSHKYVIDKHNRNLFPPA